MTSRYREAGVDIDAGNRAVRLMRQHVRSTFGPEVQTDLGLFGGLFRLELDGYRQPILVSSIDGVGTKLKLAIDLERYDTVGADLVNHCVNDILTTGARPLFFLDYCAFGRLVPERVEALVRGMAVACRAAGCALIGGETAEMPGLYAADDFDLAGCIVGLVDEAAVLTGQAVQAGDVLLALPSNGLHTNGYSLARRALGLDDPDPAARVERLTRIEPSLGERLADALLRVHRCYLAELRPWLAPGQRAIKALAHVTGGGLLENVPRVLPPGLRARFDASTWSVPPIFSLIQARGGVATAEMSRVFNMGLGMVLVCDRAAVAELRAALPEARQVGVVEPRPEPEGPQVVIEGEGASV